jgi:hypothetical protein
MLQKYMALKIVKHILDHDFVKMHRTDCCIRGYRMVYCMKFVKIYKLYINRQLVSYKNSV